MRKPRKDPRVEAWLATTKPHELHVSVLTLGEVRRGIERLRPRDPEQALVFETWLQEVENVFAERVLDVDLVVAQAWGRIDATSAVATVDGLIGATALVHGLTVVTRDTAPFERVGVPWLDPWSYGQP